MSKPDPKQANAELIRSLQSKMGTMEKRAVKMAPKVKTDPQNGHEPSAPIPVPQIEPEPEKPSIVKNPAREGEGSATTAIVPETTPKPTTSIPSDCLRFVMEGVDPQAPVCGGEQIRFSMSCTEQERLGLHALQAQFLKEGFPMSYAQVLRVSVQALLRGGMVERRIVKDIYEQDGRRKKA